MITSVVKPMGTLIIIRRLHIIASLRSIELPNDVSVSLRIITALTDAKGCTLEETKESHCGVDIGFGHPRVSGRAAL